MLFVHSTFSLFLAALKLFDPLTCGPLCLCFTTPLDSSPTTYIHRRVPYIQYVRLPPPSSPPSQTSPPSCSRGCRPISLPLCIISSCILIQLRVRNCLGAFFLRVCRLFFDRSLGRALGSVGRCAYIFLCVRSLLSLTCVPFLRSTRPSIVRDKPAY